jgi:hypothetical protein
MYNDIEGNVVVDLGTGTVSAAGSAAGQSSIAGTCGRSRFELETAMASAA